jgi:hypothetical protein
VKNRPSELKISSLSVVSAGDQEAQLVAFLELQFGRILDLALGGADPAAVRQDDGDRFTDDHRLDGGLGVDDRRVGEDRAADGAGRAAALVQRMLDLQQGGADLGQALADQLPLLLVAGQHGQDAVALFHQLGVLAADLHLFQLGQLAQAGVEDGVGLDVLSAKVEISFCLGSSS